MACQEAMWEEYLEATQQREPLLDQLEWEAAELELTDRQRFERLMERYQG